MEDFKETIEYIVDNSGDTPVYVGRSINIPSVIVNAKSLEELAIHAKITMDHYLNMVKKSMSQDNPLRMLEISREQWDVKYAEWMKTSSWIHIADALYDTLYNLGITDADSMQEYEKNTTRKVIVDRLK